jgi:hypothetical protein
MPGVQNETKGDSGHTGLFIHFARSYESSQVRTWTKTCCSHRVEVSAACSKAEQKTAMTQLLCDEHRTTLRSSMQQASIILRFVLHTITAAACMTLPSAWVWQKYRAIHSFTHGHYCCLQSASLPLTAIGCALMVCRLRFSADSAASTSSGFL